MKITQIETQIVLVPETETLAGIAVVPPTVRQFVILTMRTDAGLEGIGITFHFYANPLTGVLKAAVDALAALTIGEDPMRIEAIVQKLRAAANGVGSGGVFAYALAAIDTALWDICGKALGQPLWKMCGGLRNRIGVYASGSIRRELTDAQAAEAARLQAERGFNAIKMQLALGPDSTPARELARARAVRDALPPKVQLLTDMNQGWRVEQAIDIGKRLEEIGFAWLEDVAAHDDFAGLARVTAALHTPVAGGEYVWGIAPFAQMIRAYSVDILIIDLFRVGGISQWLKVAGMAEAFNLPVVSHVIPEILGHLVAARPNGMIVEYMNWTLPLFEQTPRIEKGEMVLPDTPGLGLAFDRDFIAKHRA